MKKKTKNGLSFLLFLILSLVASSFLNGTGEPELEQLIAQAFSREFFEAHERIEVDGGDLSGERRPRVVVDIGYGDREYWGFTNEYGQLVTVIAKEIVLQDERRERVTSSGRYYPDEARVPGTQLKEYDQGHVIADSLGGVSNAYNITPQSSFVNRKGPQAEMEKRIRDNKGCSDFVCFIRYPDEDTQIPESYEVIYRIDGKIFNSEFKNEKQRVN